MRTLGAVRKWEYPATKWFLQYRQCKQRSQPAHPHQCDSREWLITGYQLESDDNAPPNPRAQITDYNISLSGPTGPNDNWFSQSFQSKFHQKLDIVLTSQTRPTTNMPLKWRADSQRLGHNVWWRWLHVGWLLEDSMPSIQLWGVPAFLATSATAGSLL